MRVPKVRRSRHQRARPESILYVYVGLAATAFITTLIPAWTLSSQQLVAYEIMKQRPAHFTFVGRYLVGEVHEELVTVENPSPLPLLVVYATDAEGLTYSPWSALVPARGKVTFLARIVNEKVGHHEGTLRMSVLLPLLPPAFLIAVASGSMLLAALLTALVPTAGVLLLALADARARMALAQIRVKLSLRYLHSH